MQERVRQLQREQLGGKQFTGLWLAGNEGRGNELLYWFFGLGFRNGKEHGNYHTGLHRDYDMDPFLDS